MSEEVKIDANNKGDDGHKEDKDVVPFFFGGEKGLVDVGGGFAITCVQIWVTGKFGDQVVLLDQPSTFAGDLIAVKKIDDETDSADVPSGLGPGFTIVVEDDDHSVGEGGDDAGPKKEVTDPARRRFSLGNHSYILQHRNRK